jgi:hypothetical protein
MTLKTYLALSGGTLLAGYLVTAQPGVSPEPRRASSRATTAGTQRKVDIQEQATRLAMRGNDRVEYAEPSRNPFRFATRPAPARPAAPVREEIEAPAPPVAAPPPIRVSGVSTMEGTRIAYLVTVQGLLEVREGDTVPPDYRVSRIEEDAVELVAGDGTTRRLKLRP